MSDLTIKQALVRLVLGDAGIAAIIAGRFYPGVAPIGAAQPYAIYQQVGRVGLSDDLDGAGNLRAARMQIDLYAENAAVLDGLARLCRALLNGYRGTVSDAGSPPASLRIGAVRLNLELDGLESGTDPKLLRVTQDYTFTIDTTD